MNSSTRPAAALLSAAALLAGCASGPQPADHDPYLWLEDVTGEASLQWVRERNAAAQAVLAAQPGFAEMRAQLRLALEARDRIPQLQRIGGHVYNHWTDDEHPRGLWRRTTLADYAGAQPAWETVLDIDALGRAEQQSWVFGGAVCHSSGLGPPLCMLGLSRGGSDAKEWREFDLARKAFVAGGFRLPEAKGWLAWADRDSLYLAMAFDAARSTASGYGRVVQRWRRGTPLGAADTVYEANAQDVLVAPSVDLTPGYERHTVERLVDFHWRETYLLRAGQPVRIERPDSAQPYLHRDQLLLHLRSAYAAGGTTYPAGALIATDFEAYLRGERRFELLFTPTATRSLAREGVHLTQSHLLLDIVDNVTSRLEQLWREGGEWRRRAVPLPGAGRMRIATLHDRGLAADPLGDAYLLGYEDMVTPDSQYLAQAGAPGQGGLQLLKRRAPQFDAQDMWVEQLFATSRDGTRVPYFVVSPRGATAGGDHPTLLTGYGGFQTSQLPVYQAVRGRGWLARGGVYVVANIRGGGEFGPAWHLAAIKENKQRSYDDFIAVAEDLIARRITSPRRLGIAGGSNGGLLVGAVLTQRPELFNAVVAAVPLFDMRRYHKLLAGASWMAEFGDPDKPQEWAYIAKYSPYHQVKPGVRYPRVLLLTSTRDDRVHPGHARKMAARMLAQGHDVLYYENIEGGHGGAADAAQKAHMQALELSYLWLQLGRAQ